MSSSSPSSTVSSPPSSSSSSSLEPRNSEDDSSESFDVSGVYGRETAGRAKFKKKLRTKKSFGYRPQERERLRYSAVIAEPVFLSDHISAVGNEMISTVFVSAVISFGFFLVTYASFSWLVVLAVGFAALLKLMTTVSSEHIGKSKEMLGCGAGSLKKCVLGFAALLAAVRNSKKRERVSSSPI